MLKGNLGASGGGGGSPSSLIDLDTTPGPLPGFPDPPKKDCIVHVQEPPFQVWFGTDIQPNSDPGAAKSAASGIQQFLNFAKNSL